MGEDTHRYRFYVFIWFCRLVGFLLREGVDFCVLSCWLCFLALFIYAPRTLMGCLLALFNISALFAYQKRKKKLSTSLLQEGVQKFSATGDKNLPWRKILEFGRHVFDGTRTPVDLKDKWRKMLAKESWRVNRGLLWLHSVLSTLINFSYKEVALRLPVTYKHDLGGCGTSININFCCPEQVKYSGFL